MNELNQNLLMKENLNLSRGHIEKSLPPMNQRSRDKGKKKEENCNSNEDHDDNRPDDSSLGFNL